MATTSFQGADAQVLIKVCETTAIEDGEVLRIEIEGLPPLAVYNTNGEFFVSDDRCSHGDASLAEGFLDGTEIECPWHSGKFCLRTGRALTFPAVESIRVYPVTIVDEAVLIPQASTENSSETCRGTCNAPASGVA